MEDVDEPSVSGIHLSKTSAGVPQSLTKVARDQLSVGQSGCLPLSFVARGRHYADAIYHLFPIRKARRGSGGAVRRHQDFSRFRS
jgi:hypothetical protein